MVGESICGPEHLGARASPQKCSSKVPGVGLFFLVLREQCGQGQTAAERDGGGPLLLPLLHVLHLQAEGCEAGQEVGHFIHLWDKTSAPSQVPQQAQVSRPPDLHPVPPTWRVGTVFPPRARGGFTTDYGTNQRSDR